MLTENTNTEVANTGRDILMFIILIAIVVMMLAGIVSYLKIA